MLLFDVTAQFDRAVKKFTIDNPQLEFFARHHERRPVVLRNLCREILTFEARFKAKVTKEKRDWLIDETVKMFLSAIKVQRDQETWSSAQKALVRSQKDTQDAVSSLIKEV
jgi:hypothetical protein